LGIILRSDLSGADLVSYTEKKAWKALHFIMHILRKRNNSSKCLAYTIICPILEYGAACWDPYMEVQIQAFDRVQKKASKFAYNVNESNWETLMQHRQISHICAFFKAYAGEWVWKAIFDRLKQPYFLSRVDHEWKIRNRR
jgi:hypothetical protein